MTIEEYLKSEIEYSKEMMFEADDIEGKSYFEGKADALDELLRKLPEMEHEVTVREVSELCGDCSNCPYPFSPADPAGCYFDDVPGKWPIDAIERRMKEARND